MCGYAVRLRWRSEEVVLATDQVDWCSPYDLDRAAGQRRRDHCRGSGEEARPLPHTVEALIERGELAGEIIVPTDRPRQRRRIRISKTAVDDYLERARVKPGELRHLYPEWSWERYGPSR